MQTIKQKIQNKSIKIGVLGLGYVGLPLITAYAQKGFETIGFDLQQDKVNAVNSGISYVEDVPSEILEKSIQGGFVEATIDMSRLSEPDAIFICVPTPIKKNKEPDLEYVKIASKAIANNLRKGQIVILESTTYPGTTRDLVLPVIEESGLKCGEDFYLAFSPERVDPGNKKWGISNTPKVVGGIEVESKELAVLLYSQVADKVVPVSSAEVAEMTKVYENTYRNVNIAFVNEMAKLCETMGFSIWEVIDAASTKPFGFTPFYPGPGIGGHCIPLDPYYLSSKAREYDFHTRFIELGTEINESMPYHIVNRLVEAFSNKGKSLKDSKILILGVGYKPNTSDLRESPSLKLMEILSTKCNQVYYSDPYNKTIKLNNQEYNSVELNENNLKSVDCVVIATNHSCYDIESIVNYSRMIFDTRGVTREIINDKIIRFGE